MTVSTISTPVLTSPIAPTPLATAAPAPTQTGATHPEHEVSSSMVPRMQNLGLTNLRQTLMQGINEHLASYVSPRLSMLPNSDQAQAAAMTIFAGVAKTVGKNMAKTGGATTKAVGTALMWGGKTAEKIGKAEYKDAGKDNSSGSYNAFAPRNWAK